MDRSVEQPRIGVQPIIELGLLTNKEFKDPEIFKGYAKALGDQSLYDVFQERFQLPIEPSDQ